MSEERKMMTADAGRPGGDNQKSPGAGQRGPVVFEDFLLFEKMARFNRDLPANSPTPPAEKIRIMRNAICSITLQNSGKNIRHPEIISTTLGELITAVADEVTAVIGDFSDKYILVSYIVFDLLSRRRKSGVRGEITSRKFIIIPDDRGFRKSGVRI